jgi:hypothetical protein
LLYAAPGLGALVGSVLTGWIPAVRRQGWRWNWPWWRGD